MGAEDILNLKVNDTVFRAVAPPKLNAKAGEKVFAAIKVDLVHLFDPDTELRLSLENSICPYAELDNGNILFDRVYPTQRLKATKIIIC